MNYLHLARLLTTILLAAAFALPAAARDRAEEKRDEVRRMRDQVLAQLYETNPGAKAAIREAAGYAVFSNVGVNMLFASVAGGSGIVVERGSLRDSETFMNMGSAGVGLGLGVKDFRVIFVFSDRSRLKDFVEKGWDFSGQADAAAKSDDKGAAVSGAVSAIPGVTIYQLTKNGAALQVTLQGTKYWKDRDLN
jgi:lipid-binding SYLF domain-containing protein